MSEGVAYKLFEEAKTRNGFVLAEITSSLQKSIRRGWTEQACEFAYEIYISSPLLLDQLWARLMTISVEDIGFGNREVMGKVYQLNEIRKNFAYKSVDQPIFFIHAIRLMCESEKDRSSDLLKNIIIKKFAMGYVPKVPDIALDKHTNKGRAMGRDSFHFFHEASQVFPQAKVDNDYKERYEEILKEYSPDKVQFNAFQFDI